MKKPILAALGAFVGSNVPVLIISYRRDGEVGFVYALTLGIAMGAAMYVVAKWKQQKEEQKELTRKSSSSKEDDDSYD